MNVRSQIYVDKSGLLEELNRLIDTQQRFVCVTRPRRFGKPMAADMLSAYYGCKEDTSALFDGLKIGKMDSYKAHLNQYNVLKINMQEFLSATDSVDEMLAMLKRYIIFDLMNAGERVRYMDESNFMQVMKDFYAATGRSFVILIDEWDCLFREYRHDQEAQKKYLDFLRAWLKDQAYVSLAYMTGILPVKKYGTHSALNMFTEYSMTDPGALAEFFGFTEDEVRTLCAQYVMNFEEARAWYDGYALVAHGIKGDRHYSMYNPKSVVESMLRHKFDTYWNQTETYEALKVYIQINMEGLKDAVVRILQRELRRPRPPRLLQRRPERRNRPRHGQAVNDLRAGKIPFNKFFNQIVHLLSLLRFCCHFTTIFLPMQEAYSENGVLSRPKSRRRNWRCNVRLRSASRVRKLLAIPIHPPG